MINTFASISISFFHFNRGKSHESKKYFCWRVSEIGPEKKMLTLNVGTGDNRFVMDNRHKGREREKGISFNGNGKRRRRIPQIIINKSIYILRNFLLSHLSREEESDGLTRWFCSLKDY